MNSFRTVEDLRRSIWAAGLGAHAEAIVATARPTILFARLQATDDGLPAGTAKMGGFPDLPEGFAWPVRPPFPDADRRAKELRDAAQGSSEILEQMMQQSTETLTTPSAKAQIAKIVADREAQAAVQYKPMPLAFTAQFDLAALAREPGFDPAFPKTGVLSVFADITNQDWWRAHRVVWHDAPVASLKCTPPPADLVAYYDDHGSFGGSVGEDGFWAKQTKAETLIPFSGVSVPHHWRAGHPSAGALRKSFEDWLHSDAHKLYAEAPAGTDENRSGNFGDQLGGWPPIIQGDVEDEIDGDGRPVAATPGQTSWRQIFTYGGEYHGGTRTMPYEGVGDGAVYLMIRQEDLAARRFDRMQDVVQRT